ncbi:hypothetical protein ACH4TX_20090 [Streptomyces sp. NPDC021098]|uniref:hypothetical protein n=1 Tax=unclassified Streptomyces TaxID=2593676 RepID=UPI00379E528F
MLPRQHRAGEAGFGGERAHQIVEVGVGLDAVGLGPALEFHSLCRPCITHLIEDGHDPLFVRQQVGHHHASTTAISI